jgi:hypothetical protein
MDFSNESGVRNGDIPKPHFVPELSLHRIFPRSVSKAPIDAQASSLGWFREGGTVPAQPTRRSSVITHSAAAGMSLLSSVIAKTAEKISAGHRSSSGLPKKN